MRATLVKLGTRYACNIDKKGGLDMLATSVTLETRYAWKGFRWGLGMRATLQNFQMLSL